jgi:F-type H+-transporting ATPase subunit delta
MSFSMIALMRQTVDKRNKATPIPVRYYGKRSRGLLIPRLLLGIGIYVRNRADLAGRGLTRAARLCRDPKTAGEGLLRGSRRSGTEDGFSLASEATGVSGLAERYAVALFDLADERRMLDEVASDLRQLRAMLQASSDLTRLIRSPVLSRDQQGAAMGVVAERAELSPLVRDFLAVVARNRRLFAVPAMIEAFLTKLAARRGEVNAQVTAAQSLTEAQLAALNEQLRRSIGSRVSVDVQVDPGLIGGMIVKVGSRMVDGSVRSKLQRLQLAMKSTG